MIAVLPTICIAKYSANVLFVMPDMKSNGRLVESSPKTFQQNLK